MIQFDDSSPVQRALNLDELEKQGLPHVQVVPPMAGSGLVAKLAEILGEIHRIEKGGFNDYHKYHYLEEEAILDELRPRLSARGIFIFTSIDEVTNTVLDTYDKDGNGTVTGQKLITSVRTKHTFADAQTGERISVMFAGSGEDAGDKGVYKAATGAMKYFLTKNFLMSAGDPDEASGSKKSGGGKSQKQKPQQDGPQETASGVVKSVGELRSGDNWKVWGVKTTAGDFIIFNSKALVSVAERFASEQTPLVITWVQDRNDRKIVSLRQSPGGAK
ncbi:MAG: ERF family protein [Acidobacteria bacterium]|nr:ERF family protein [Acidobacteriota bacterium]